MLVHPSVYLEQGGHASEEKEEPGHCQMKALVRATFL